MTDVAQAVRRALEEDIGTGDVTSQACVPADRRATGFFIGRQRLILAGTIQPTTLVWREGMANWEPLARAQRPIGAPPVAQGTGMPEEEAQALRIKDPARFLEYARQVWASSDEYLSSADEADFGSCPYVA